MSDSKPETIAQVIARDAIEDVIERQKSQEWNLQMNEINSKPNVHKPLAISEEIQIKFPKELIGFLEGLGHSVSYEVCLDKPTWYDEEKFKLGQKFANNNYGAINYAQMLTLMILFSFDTSLKPLIYTRRSDTTYKAGSRYLSTALRVLSWYEEDIWDKNSLAHKNIQIVRAYHRNTAKRMMNESKNELEYKSKLKNLLPPNDIKCQSLTALKKDFPGICTFKAIPSNIIINQTEMSFTLFGFMGLVILHPEKFGILEASCDELSGFVHVWRVVGYLLGIEDRFNLCQGTLDEVKSRCQNFVDKIFIGHNLLNLNEEWEHMSRCMIDGIAMVIPGPTFETSILHLFWAIGVQPTVFKKKLKWKYIVKHYVNRFFMNLIFRFTYTRVRFNNWVKARMRLKAPVLINEQNFKDINENK